MQDYLANLDLPIEYFTKVEMQDGILKAASNSNTITREIHRLEGKWEFVNWLNVPGPFYGAFTDTCCDGTALAPLSVLADLNGQEFVFRQPRNSRELNSLLDAAIIEPFGGYGWDGNHHWTLSSILEWYRRKDEMMALMGQIKEEIVNDTVRYYSNESNYFSLIKHVGKDQRFSKERFLDTANKWRLAQVEWENFISIELESYLCVYAFFVENNRLPNQGESLPNI
jgi:hypothetical protein